jgi:hypothetical protein
MNKIKHFTLLIFCLPLSIYGYTSFEKLTVESRIFNSTLQSAFDQVDNEIQLISIDEKKVYVLISTNGVVDQSQYSKAEEVNAHFLKTEGVIECSYAWNSNMMKLTLDKKNAKEILINTFGFEPTIISNLF